MLATVGLLAVALVVLTLAVPASAGHQRLRTLVPLGLGTALAAGVLVALVARRTGRRRSAVLPLAGLAAGLVVGFGTDLWRGHGPGGHGSEVVYHGRYVPIDGVTTSKAYSSTLDITYGVTVPPWSLLLVGGAAGLLAGLVVWIVVRLRGWPSPSGRARR